MLISELKQDPKNANKGTKRGNAAVSQSLKTLGAGRSILVDKHGNVIAGNKTAAAALKAGIADDAVVVQTTGDQLVIVQRADLDLTTDAKAKQLALADNRTAELGLEWNPEVIAELASEMDMSPYFTVEELNDIVFADAPTETTSDDQTGDLSGSYLNDDHSRTVFLNTLERLRQRHHFFVFGYVLMPEHVHLLLSESKRRPLATTISVLKGQSSKLLKGTRTQFWQIRYYDFNVFTQPKFVEKLRYIHRNPVERGLVEKPEDYPWSSYRHWSTGEPGPVEIESHWTQTRRERSATPPIATEPR